MLQEIFYAYEEKLFDSNIIRVEERNGKIYVYQSPDERFITDMDIIQPFPAGLETRVKQAVLTLEACSDALVFMHDLVEMFVAGKRVPYASITHLASTDLSSTIVEVAVELKNNKLEMISLVSAYCIEDSNTAPHDVFKVTLKNGDEYVLDLAGA